MYAIERKYDLIFICQIALIKDVIYDEIGHLFYKILPKWIWFKSL
ncbi:MAG: hypothetical protein ACI9JT_001241 [Polaribacter sp.]|jgi:hypothetical protein